MTLIDRTQEMSRRAKSRPKDQAMERLPRPRPGVMCKSRSARPRLEDLEARPSEEIQRVYETLGLAGCMLAS